MTDETKIRVEPEEQLREIERSMYPANWANPWPRDTNEKLANLEKAANPKPQ